MMTQSREEYKFRISCKLKLRDHAADSEFEFRYHLLGEAREKYKTILHGLYRRRDVIAFSICLNRCRDHLWRHAIHKEIVQ
jgi:hypothetical protein